MEGRREIEAAKLRLAAATKQMSSATHIMEAARKLMETARKEVEDAESFLKETEDRLEVIDVDVVADSQGSKKRRKLSMSSEGSDRVPVDNNNNNSVDVIGNTATSIIRQSTGINNSAARQNTTVQKTPSHQGREGVQDEASAAVIGTTATSTTRQSNSSDNNIARQNTTAQTSSSWGWEGVQGKAREKHVAEFEAAVNKHRDETFQLLRESAMKGESSISTEKMAATRTKNIFLMRAANLMVCQFGGMELCEAKLTTLLSNAENEVLTLYVPEMSIVVSGCGILEANGKYKKSFTKLKNGVPMYRKEGKWNEKTVSFVMYRKARVCGSKCWLMSVAGTGSPTQILYKAPNDTNSWRPPSDGWVAVGGGINPAPKLKL
mmetsp:Transcript_27864/g.50400  ORF Transcript_27864/g.50400 Transcript_27864/m.50400 type:complete len:378 (+) Transcript_27864:96-1229(+)|eukprot:CAMPEP_0201897598 /NCGR_PEP_ID=MMETSP0902-20130614/46874_1 /ASSEMBLY_ACC=CAM_ASM_000551 /TAXON_ID=420261 /ORGANISM="Thalassiosira antarctica, Strain CCMP982" /LENGTH=377 /DNA_ID=CAMNT_0048430503 /DNA_START=68 /DNA_END=1201 /DNA_ORIENTATION=-